MKGHQIRGLPPSDNDSVAQAGFFGRCRMLFFGCLALLLGCATSDPRHAVRPENDLGQFILEYTMEHGARPVITNGLPAITSRWEAAFDPYGVQIKTDPAYYEAIKSFLQQAFGDPYLEEGETTDGGLLGVYREIDDDDAGVTIQFGKNVAENEGAFLIIVHIPVRGSEWSWLWGGSKGAAPQETPANSDQPKTEPAYVERERRKAEDLIALISLAKTIVSDGAVEEDEIRGLERWLNAKPERPHSWFSSDLSENLEILLSDDQLGQEELETLLPWLEHLANLGE